VKEDVHDLTYLEDRIHLRQTFCNLLESQFQQTSLPQASPVLIIADPYRSSPTLTDHR